MKRKPYRRIPRLRNMARIGASVYADIKRRQQAKKDQKERQEDEARHERMIQFNAKLKAIEIEHQVKKEKEEAKRPRSGPEYSI